MHISSCTQKRASADSNAGQNVRVSLLVAAQYISLRQNNFRMQSVFVQFLNVAKEIGDDISALAKDIRMAEALVQHSTHLSASPNAEECAAELVSAFHAKVAYIRTRIDTHSACCAELREKERENGELHIASLSERLSKKIFAFSDVRSRLAEEAEERAHLSHELREAGAVSPQQAEAVRALGEQHPAVARQKSTEAALTDLQRLETLSIQLNNIVVTTGLPFDRVSTQAAEARHQSGTTNELIAQATRRRKRTRQRKLVFFAFLALAAGTVGIYFGDKVLDFLIKVKRSIK